MDPFAYSNKMLSGDAFIRKGFYPLFSSVWGLPVVGQGRVDDHQPNSNTETVCLTLFFLVVSPMWEK